MTDSLYKIWGSTLTGTANAIRTKKGTSGDIDPANFEAEILSIPSGGGSNLGTLNVTTNGTYTPTSPLDGWDEVNVNVAGGGVNATSIDIVTELPSTLIEGAVYLIPNGEQVVPPLPLSIDSTMNRWAVTCEVPNTARTFPYSLTVAQIKSSPKYYCFGAKAGTAAEPQSFVGVPSTRGNYPGTMTFTDGNSQVMPTYIYKYEPATDTDWVDITSTITQSDWESGVVDNNMLDCFYSTYSMIRRSLNHIAYETTWNAIDTNGRLIKPEDVDNYIVYYVQNGVATNLGSRSLKWVDEYFKGFYLSRETLDVNFDFTSNTPFYDSARGMTLNDPTGGDWTQAVGTGLTLTSASGYFNLQYGISRGECYRIELELGDYAISSGLSYGASVLNLSSTGFQNEQGSVCWKPDSQKWAVYTGQWIYADSTIDINYFKNKKMIVLHNCKYENGQIVKYPDQGNTYRYFNLYDEDWNLIIGNYVSNNYNVSGNVGLGGTDDCGCQGMVYKSLKVYHLNLDVSPSDNLVKPLTITMNGNYEAHGDDYIGFNPITVDVPQGLNGGIVSHYDFKNEQDLDDLVRTGVSAVENDSSYFSMVSDKGLLPTDKSGQLDCNLSILLYNKDEAEIKIKFGEELNDFSVSRLISFKSANGDEHTLGWNDGSYWIWYSNGGNLYNTGVTNYDIFENSELIIKVKCINNTLNFTYILPDGTIVDANLQQGNGANVYLGQLSYSSNGFRNLIVEDIETTYKTYNSKDVKFYDYDGTVAYEYYPSEFMSLSSMPSQPTHTGLTFDGWNWTLSDAKDYVTNHGKIDIGATYTWNSSDTEIDIRLDNGRLSPYLVLGINGTVTVDWGDSSATENITGSSTNTFIRTQHVYSQAGEYTITITPESGTSISIGNSSNKILMKKSSGNYNSEDYPYAYSIIRLRLGQGVIPLVSECCRYFRNLESLIMHSSITISGTSCFRECESLEYVCLPNSISTIPGDTFNGALAIKIITLPKEVTSVGNNAFRYAYGATAVCMNNKDVSYGSDTFAQDRGLRHIYIPDSQTILGSEMFKECTGLEEIIFSNSLTTINSGAFATCTSITELNFPSTLNAINNSDAFSKCQALRKIRFNKAIMSTLGSLSFAYCYGLREVINLPEVTTYGVDIFRDCYGLKELIPDSHMTSIPNGFVRTTTLEEFNIPSGVTSLGNYAFYNIDTLRSLTIPSGVTSIGEYCFAASNNLIELTLPSGLTSIPNNMCEDCFELKKINIPNGVTVINATAFNDCSALTEIIIPDSVTQIKGDCFKYCYSLGMIKFEGSTPPTLTSTNCFGGLPTDCIIYVPTGSLSDYTSAQYYPSSSTYTYVEY